jgi:hypothetical protein
MCLDTACWLCELEGGRRVVPTEFWSGIVSGRLLVCLWALYWWCIEIDHKEMVCEEVNWIRRSDGGSCGHSDKPLGYSICQTELSIQKKCKLLLPSRLPLQIVNSVVCGWFCHYSLLSRSATSVSPPLSGCTFGLVLYCMKLRMCLINWGTITYKYCYFFDLVA